MPDPEHEQEAMGVREGAEVLEKGIGELRKRVKRAAPPLEVEISKVNLYVPHSLPFPAQSKAKQNVTQVVHPGGVELSSPLSV